MLRPLARMQLVALAAAIAPACSQDNPLFALASGSDMTTLASTSTSPTTSPTTTGDPGLTTADPGSGSGSESSAQPSTTSASATSITTDPIDTGSSTSTGEPLPDTSTGEPLPDTTGPADTGEPPPEAVTVIASLATCVLLAGNGWGYLGPLGCETLTEMNDVGPEIGVMVLDTSYLIAGGRESRVYIRFEVPVAPVGKVLTSATLTVQVSGNFDAGASWSGNLYLSDPFDGNGLNVFAPGGLLLIADPGPSVPNQASSWQIPVEKVVPNQPLFLGLGAIGTDTVLYRSTRASDEKKPRLQLTYQ